MAELPRLQARGPARRCDPRLSRAPAPPVSSRTPRLGRLAARPGRHDPAVPRGSGARLDVDTAPGRARRRDLGDVRRLRGRCAQGANAERRHAHALERLRGARHPLPPALRGARLVPDLGRSRARRHRRDRGAHLRVTQKHRSPWWSRPARAGRPGRTAGPAAGSVGAQSGHARDSSRVGARSVRSGPPHDPAADRAEPVAAAAVLGLLEDVVPQRCARPARASPEFVRGQTSARRAAGRSPRRWAARWSRRAAGPVPPASGRRRVDRAGDRFRQPDQAARRAGRRRLWRAGPRGARARRRSRDPAAGRSATVRTRPGRGRAAPRDRPRSR